MDAADIVKKIKERKMIIIGAGMMAERLLIALQRLGLSHMVSAVAVTNKKMDLWHGYRVITIQEAACEKNVNYYIAVHKVNYLELYQEAQRAGIDEIIDISMCIDALQFGEVLKTKVEICPQEILCAYKKENLFLASRCYAIDSYLRNDYHGWETYLKINSLFCTKTTVKKRAKAFAELIENWKNNGYCNTECIKVDANSIVIDGYHRAALALFSKQKWVCVDIYEFDANLYTETYLEKLINFSVADIEKAGCSKEQCKVIEDYNNKLWNE